MNCSFFFSLFSLFPLFFLFFSFFFFFNDTATTEIYTLSLHDALPISRDVFGLWRDFRARRLTRRQMQADRKSTRLNSSHVEISYAVFCLQKKTVKCAVAVGTLVWTLTIVPAFGLMSR